jgi:branched-chain amino acid transport system permease protein
VTAAFQESEIPDIEKRDIGAATLSLAAATALWLVVIAFLLIPNDYAAFGVAGLSIAAVEGCRRFAPRAFETVVQTVQSNMGLVFSVSLLALVLLPVFLQGNPYWIHILTIVFIYGIAAEGLNIQLGEIGAINVGYAGFFAIGAYVSAIGIVDYGANFWASLVYATVACWAVGLLIGLCTIKTSGDYLSLVTLGFGLIVYQLCVNMAWLTHGTDGIHVPTLSIFGHGFGQSLDLGMTSLPKESNFYYVALVALLVAMFVVRRMSQSWIGRTWAAMRQDPIGAGCFGVNIPVLQMISFAFGAAFAGVAGALYAGEIGFIEPGEFTIFMSITLICMVILGGMGSWWGVVCGTFIMVVVPEKLREFQELRYLLYGVVLLCILIYRPHGLFASARRRHEKVLG